MGSAQGVQSGHQLLILGKDRRVKGTIEVREVGPESSTGYLPLDADTVPDDRIGKKRTVTSWNGYTF